MNNTIKFRGSTLYMDDFIIITSENAESICKIKRKQY